MQELQQYRFHDLPSSASFVLENAYLLPGEAITSVSQLLVFRELAGRMIDGLAHCRPEQILSTEEVHAMTTRLGLMQQLVDELFDLIKDIHDTPVTKLLKEREG